MLGAIIGDIVGSRFEFNPTNDYLFEPLFHQSCQFTDDTICTVAVADAIRRAVSLGADADTLGAIVGSIAEAIWGVPSWMEDAALAYLPLDMLNIYKQFKNSKNHGN